METLAVATGSCAVVGSIFGMNLLSGLENHPNAFFYVTGGSAIMMSAIMVIVFLRFRQFVSTTPSGVEHQHSAMKHFFSYIEDIEAKVRLSDSISRREFESIVTSVIGNVDPKEIGQVSHQHLLFENWPLDVAVKHVWSFPSLILVQF